MEPAKTYKRLTDLPMHEEIYLRNGTMIERTDDDKWDVQLSEGPATSVSLTVIQGVVANSIKGEIENVASWVIDYEGNLLEDELLAMPDNEDVMDLTPTEGEDSQRIGDPVLAASLSVGAVLFLHAGPGLGRVIHNGDNGLQLDPRELDFLGFPTNVDPLDLPVMAQLVSDEAQVYVILPSGQPKIFARGDWAKIGHRTGLVVRADDSSVRMAFATSNGYDLVNVEPAELVATNSVGLGKEVYERFREDFFLPI